MKNPLPPPMVLVSLAFAALVAGCSGKPPATWSYVSQAIIQPNCATADCHSALSAQSGVRLNDLQTGYQTLLGRCFVVPGDSAHSELIDLLNGKGNLRMPPDNPLPQAEIDVIAKWIDDGALNDTTDAAPMFGQLCTQTSSAAATAPTDAGAGQ